MSTANTGAARASGSFKILGELEVVRLGFGAMRIVGEGVWGEPVDRPEALRVLRRAAELGVNFIDTADSYGPFVSEDLICEALHPYPEDLVIATKGGFTRSGPGVWAAVGRPEYLRQCVEMSLRRLKLERIDLYQLHRIDPKVPADEQFGVLREMQDEGKIRLIGLSEVGVADIEAASKHFQVATVQNLYNLTERRSEAALDFCEAQGVGFIPWYPLASGKLAKESEVFGELAKKYGATPSQLALAWVLARAEVMLPIPGTSQVGHLEENVAAAALSLDSADLRALDEQGRHAWQARRQA